MQSLDNYSPKNLRAILKNRFSVTGLDPSRLMWEKVNSLLLQRVGITRFNEFVSKSNIVSFDDDTVVLACPDYNCLLFLKSFYYAAITDAVRTVTNRNTRIIFTLDGVNKRPVHSGTAPAYCSHTKTAPEFSSRQTLENFIVGDSNKMAFKAVSYFASGGAKTCQKLLLHSAPGLGKTHLLNGLCLKIVADNPGINAHLVDCEDFTGQYTYAVQNGKIESFRHKYRNLDCLLVDNIHLLSNKTSSQEEFLHTFNDLEKKERRIIMTSTCPIADISGFIPKLASRLKSCPSFSVDLPAKDTRMGILKTICLHEGFRTSAEHVNMTAEKTTLSVRDMIDAFYRISALRNPDNSTVEKLLDELSAGPSKNLSPEDICWAVAQKMGIGMRDILSASRSKNVALARQICMYLSKTHTGATCRETGKFFGNRDHATATASFKKISRLINTDPSVKKIISEIEKSLQDPVRTQTRCTGQPRYKAGNVR